MPLRRAGLLALLALALPSAAHAAQVSYVDGGQVWISTLDGSAKRSLSGPSPDEKPYQEAVQSDDGHVLGVRRVAGQQGQLNATQLWAADGSTAGTGTLTMFGGYNVNAYPVTLDLTPDGKVVVYGYSLSRVVGGQFQLKAGTAGMTSSGQFTQPVDIPIERGTLAGGRVVGASGQVVALQAAGSAPFGPDFQGWIPLNGPEVFRTDVAANGSAVAIELAGQPVDRQVALGPVAGIGGAFDDPRSCYLDTEGDASDVSFSPDGTAIAWKDARGVVTAGAPAWFASDDVTMCSLSSPPVVISATGKMPSIGGSTAATPPAAPVTPPGTTTPAPAATPAPSGTAPGTTTTPAAARPKATVAAKVKASALAKGVTVAVKVARAGTVTVTATVGKVRLASAKAKAKRAGTVKLKLRAARKLRAKLKRYRGKTLVLTVKGPGGTTKVQRKLR